MLSQRLTYPAAAHRARPFRPHTAAVLLACLLALPCTSRLAAQPSDAETTRAKQLFESGVAEYDAGHYANALSRFQEAYRIKPHPLVRVNIANCYQRLDRPVEAIENFEGFLSMTQGSQAQREEVRAALRELREKVGQIALSVSPPGARILIDDKDERHAPVSDPVLASVGRHRVTISLEGYETALRVIDVHARETASLQVALAAVPAPEPEIAAAPPPPPPIEQPDEVELLEPAPAPPLPEPATAKPAPAPRRRVALPVSVWVSGGATVALLVSAIVTGQLALSSSREFDGNVAAVRNTQLSEFQRAGAWARGVDAADRADALAAATDIMLGLSLAGAGLTTYFYLADRAEREAQGLSVRTSLGAGRIQVQGTF